ncbi:MAG: apt, partial [Mucilaginibacter sp.]|nr:apt [Mucilaginibacter sp.]
MIEQQIKLAVRDIPDFPKPGIIFKDITTILKDPILCEGIVDAFVEKLQGIRIDAIAGVESRGFLFGLTLATKLRVPFIPVRKAGKLPYT